jgi:hypothetical protein
VRYEFAHYQMFVSHHCTPREGSVVVDLTLTEFRSKSVLRDGGGCRVTDGFLILPCLEMQDLVDRAKARESWFV